MPILGVVASSTRQGQATDTGAMFPLQVITVGPAGAADVTFTNIPNTYTHLQIRCFLKSTAGSGVSVATIQFNSDSGSNYAKHYLEADGSTVASGGSASSTNLYGPQNPRSNQTGWGVGIIDILDYANTNKYKTMRLITGIDNNGSGLIDLLSGLWMNTNAITSIKISADVTATSFAQYSQFALYAVKGA